MLSSRETDVINCLLSRIFQDKYHGKNGTGVKIDKAPENDMVPLTKIPTAFFLDFCRARKIFIETAKQKLINKKVRIVIDQQNGQVMGVNVELNSGSEGAKVAPLSELVKDIPALKNGAIKK